MPLQGAPTTRAHIPSLLERDISKVIFNEWSLYPEQYAQFYNIETADKKSIKHTMVAGLGEMPMKAEGAPVTYDSIQEAYTKTYDIVSYSLGIKATREARQDDLYGPIREMAKELGKTVKYTKNVLAMTPLNNATTDTQYTADGTNFTLLSTTHFRVDNGTWTNRPTSAADLSIESLEAGLISFMKDQVDLRGRKQMIEPKYLVVGTSDFFIAHRLLEATLRPFSNNNDPNIIKSQFNLQVVCLKHMSDDTRWFLIADQKDNGWHWLDRERFTLRTTDEQDTGNFIWQTFSRFAYGVTTPTGTYGSPP